MRFSGKWKQAWQAAAFFNFILTTQAIDYTWSGLAPAPNNHNWSVEQNWMPSGVPGTGDTATIGGDFNGGGFTVALAGATNVAGLTLNGSTLGGSGSLTVNGGIMARASTLSLGGGIIANDQVTVTVLDQSPATESFLGGPLTLNSVSTVASNASLTYTAPVTIQNNGTFVLSDNAILGFGTVGGQFVNNGTFGAGNSTATGGAPTAVFTNTPLGVVKVSAGLFNINGPSWAGSGGFFAGSSAVIQINLAYGFTAAFHNGTVFNGPGTTVLLGGVNNNNLMDGSVNVGGTFQLGNAAGGAGLVNLGSLNVASNGGFNWFGGFIGGNDTNLAGVVSVAQGGVMSLNGLTTFSLLGTVITNNGNIVWKSNSDLVLGYNAVIVNENKFLFEHDSASVQVLSSGGAGASLGSIQNWGNTSRDPQATTNGITTIAAPFYNNAGNAIVYNGTTSMEGGGILGDWLVNSNALARFTQGSFAVGAGSLFYGPALLDGGATFDLGAGGKLVVSESSFQQNGGLIKGAGWLEIFGQSTFLWSGGAIAITNATAAIKVDNGCAMVITGNGLRGTHTITGGRLLNNGMVTVTTNADNFDDYVYAGDGEVFDNFGTFIFQTDQGLVDISTASHPVFINEAGGTVVKSAANGTSRIGFTFKNLGQVLAQSGTLEFAAYDDTGTQTPDFLRLQEGTLKFDQSTSLNGKMVGNGKIIVSGTLTNQGSIEGDQVQILGDSNNQGDVVTGDAPGVFTVYNFSQSGAGRLIVPVQGTNAATPDFGQLAAQGAVTLGGTLVVNLTNGYAPPIGSRFPFLTAHLGVSGTFSNVVMPPGFALIYTNSGATLVVTGASPAQLQFPQFSAGQFQFGFNTVNRLGYTVQYADDLASRNWLIFTNVTGDGSFWQILAPTPPAAHRFFRVSEP